jgi:hypothetical protein
VWVFGLNNVLDEQTIISIAEPLSKPTLSSSENKSKSLSIRANKTRRWIGTIRRLAAGLGGFSLFADETFVLSDGGFGEGVTRADGLGKFNWYVLK